MKTAGMNAGERLLPIEEMEPWAQSAFKGFKYATPSLLTNASSANNLDRRKSVLVVFQRISPTVQSIEVNSYPVHL